MTMIDEIADLMLTAAHEAHDAGICVVQGQADGSKRPVGTWRQWQERRPSDVDIQTWFANGHPAMGVICGAVSGGLEILEIEGKAMDLWGDLRLRLDQAGLLELFKRLSVGYTERSPSGGLHFAYRIDGEVPGNTKLACRQLPDGSIETMIETRGEGGFMLVAPSHGPTHDSGKPYELITGGWETLVTLSREQRDEIVRICESFDEMPAQPSPPPAERHYADDTWLDRALADLLRSDPIEQVLERNGWTFLEADQMGTLWRRPGKDRGSCSARVNTNGRLHVFSSSTPFKSGTKGTQTYDAVDVELTYRNGTPPSSDQRVDYIKAAAIQTGEYTTPKDDWSFVGSGAAAQPSELNLGEEFWSARPWLGHIRQAAHARTLSPDGVLGALLARYATAIPVSRTLPPVVGGIGTFDYTSMLVARSGGGKTSSMMVAKELFDFDDERLLMDPPIGSGEGLIQAFLEAQTIEVDGKKLTNQVQILDGIHLSVDEGSVLSAQMKREGTTIAQTLCSAWAGQALGQLNASAATKRLIKARHARVTAVMGIQPDRGEALVSGAAAEMGLTQRMVFFSLNDPAVPEVRPVWPGRLDVPLPPGRGQLAQPVKVAHAIQDEIYTHRHGVVTGRVKEDPLDAHMHLARLKTAGILSFMDGRNEIDLDDWALAGEVLRVSRNVRQTILDAARSAQMRVAATRATAAVHIATAVETASHQRALELGAKAIARRLARAKEAGEGAISRRVLYHAVAGKHRAEASFDEMLDHAESLRWVVKSGDTFTAGDAGPL